MKKISTVLFVSLFFSFVFGGKTFASDLFWVNNAGNWSDASHWSLSSGGPSANRIPTANDHVYFDANSFDRGNQHVNISGLAKCKNFICESGIPVAFLEGSKTAELQVSGSFQLSRSIQNQFRGIIRFTAKGSQQTISNPGQSFKGSVIFEGDQAEWSLTSAFILEGTTNLILKSGTINSNSYPIGAYALIVSGLKSGALNLHQSKLILQNGITVPAESQFKINQKTAQILNKATGQLPGINAIIDSIKVTITPPKCNGDSNAIVKVDSVYTATPGNYTYSLTDGNVVYTGNPMINVYAGTYIITVTNINNGEVLNQFVIINDPPPIIVPSYVKTQPKCFGDCNGKVRANPLGGTPPYAYLWTNGQTGQTDSLLCGGIVGVTVTDSKGCFKAFTTTLNQPTAIASNLTKKNLTCNGVCDGMVAVAPTGGAGNFAIAWTPGGATNPQNNICAGSYKVIITDGSGCIKRDSTIVTQPVSLTISTVKTDVSCNLSCDGSITATPTGGRPPYTFSWGAPLSASTPTVGALCAGTYTVFVRDSANCLSQQSVTINQPNALSAVITQSPVTCFGLCNGSALSTTSGGTAPYTFSWSAGGSSSTLSNLCAGPYTLFITDAKACSTSVNVTITQPSQLVANSTKTDISCNGLCDGTTLLAPSGGTGPYTFLWTPGNQTSSGLSSLCVGTYNYTIRDANNCALPGSLTIAQPQVLTVATTPTQPSCNGVCDGQIVANATGGTGPYSYSWSNGQLTATATGLCPGSYTVFVTDSRGCTSTGSATISQPTLLTIGVASTTSSCGICTGTATVTPAGGTSPYTYSWSNGQTTQTANTLCIGNYNVIVSDAKGCQVNNSLTISPTVVIQITSSTTNALCANSCNGTATANASGGQPPYTFQWFPSGQTTQTAVGLCAGVDSVRVTDANGCFNVSSITFTDPPVLNNIVTTTNSICAGSCIGTAVSVPSGGTPPYTFSWSAVAQTGNSVTALCAGPQSVTITDNNGCILVSNFNITEPAPIVANETVVKSQCLLNNGSISLSPSGGTGPYTYSWSSPLNSSASSVSNLAAGSYSVTITDNVLCSVLFTIAISDAAGPTATSTKTNPSCPSSCDGAISTSPPIGSGPFSYLWTPGNSNATSLSNLCPGNYSVKITDVNGCTTILNDTIVAPPALQSNATVTNTSCGGQCNGALVVASSGGTGPYTYSWSTGATGSSISGLCVGSYIVRITDANNCIGTDTLKIAEPAILGLVLNQTNVTCNNACDGKITGVASGGTQPYSYSWSNGVVLPSLALLCPNTYSLTVTDANNCVITQSATITQPLPLQGQITVTPNSCNASCNGTADVIASGGTAPYTYLWSPGNATTNSISNLCAGNYSVTITDFNLCTSQPLAIITEPAPLTATVTFTPPTCNGACDATATATGAGGTGPYTYSWSINGLTSSTVSNICAGSYTVFVTDLNGCTSSQVVVITQPLPLTALASKVNPTCQGICNGTATASPAGGTGSYSYSWVPGGQSTQSISNLCAGAISVFVTDVNGCSATQSLTLTDPASIAIVSGATPANCGACDGALAVFPSGGSGAPYTYSWSPGNQSGQIASNLCAGLYTVFIKDVNNCEKSFPLTLSNNSGPNADTTSVVDASCNGVCDGSLSVVVSGGILPYSYSWLPSGPIGVASITNQCAGVYVLQTTDAAGCLYLTTDSIAEPLPILANDSTVAISCNGLSDGQIFLHPSGGNGTYTYTWNPPIGATTSSISNLAVGNYSVVISDGNNCSAPFTFPIVNPTAITINETHSNLTCNAVCNGSITVSPTGGTSPYRYSWSSNPNDTLATVGNLCAGTYTVFVKDSRNCVQQKTIQLTQPLAILPNLVKKNNTCFGECNASARVNPTGGSGAYTYSWIGVSSLLDSVSGLCSGNYAVRINDGSGCFIDVPVAITDPPLLNSNLTTTAISCNGLCDGSSIANTIGGTAPYTYLWSPGNISSSGISNLCAGTYVLTVRDSNNCSTTQTAVITEPLAISSTFTSIQPTCNTSNGSIILTASGGTPGYSYSWSPGGFTNDTLINLVANLYTVSITDSRGCTSTTAVPLSTNSFTLNKIGVNASCFGSCNGIASVNPIGGNGPFTYLWTPGGASTDSITNLCPSTYIPKVTDANGCIVFETITIIEPTEVNANVSTVNASCGLCDGSATVSGSGGTGSYSYLWSINQSTSNVSNLCAGTYSVRVTDNSGCSTTNNLNISNSTGPSSESINKTNVTCFGACNGTVSITPIGGTAPYTYYWLQSGATSNSLTGLCAGAYDFEIGDANGCKRVSSVTISEPAALVSGASLVNATCGVCNGGISLNPSGGLSPYTYAWAAGQSTSTLSNLCAGSYSVVITDANNCSYSDVILLNNNNAPTISFSAKDVSCSGICNGSIKVSAFGGAQPYLYSWSSGHVSDSIVSACAGNYLVTITDANNCKSTTSVVIDEPSPLVFSLPNTVNANCGLCDGSASVLPNGGTLPYTLLWSSGDTGSFATNLCAGVYTVLVSDKNSCSINNNINISNTNSPQVNATVTNESCANLCDGAVSLSVSGGTPPYSYFWLQGGQSTSSITGLCANTYDYQVTDSAGCIFTSSITLSSPTVLAYNETQVEPTCGVCNGTITVNPSGGTGGYTFSWMPGGASTASISNLCAGTYTLYMSDASGCDYVKVFNLSNSNGPGLSASSTNVSCNSSCDGSANVIASGGNSPFTYSWLPGGQIAPSITGLCAGTYSVTVTDNIGCKSIEAVTITEPPPILFSISNTTNAICGQCNGGATIVPSGGFLPNSVLWSNGDQGLTASNLCAGVYTVTVTDNGSCAQSKNVTISNNSAPVVTVNKTDETCAGRCDGTANLLAVSGAAPVSFYWLNNASTSASLTGLCAGSYDYEVSDTNGCITSGNLIITAASTVNVNYTAVNPTCGLCDGSLSAFVTGGVGPYTFSWNPSSTNTSVINNLCAGIYIATITDVNGCAQVDTTILANATGPSISYIAQNSTCSSSCNGSITAVASGINPGYNFSWIPGNQVTSSVSNLCAGNYIVEATDNLGCKGYEQISITAPDPISLSLSQIKNVLCFGDSTGSITVIPSGGTLPYHYLWSTGDTTPTLLNIPNGSLFVTITDGNGCDTVSPTLIINTPTKLTASAVVTNAQCSNTPDGAINLNPSGGTPPYTFLWNNPGASTTEDISGVLAGIYSVSITDANGCNFIYVDTIVPLINVQANAGPDDTLCLSDQITLQGNGGIKYNWYVLNGSTLNLIDSTSAVIVSPALGSNIYVLEAINGLCSGFDTVSIFTHPTPVADLGDDQSIIVGATVQLNASGGSSGASYLWSPTKDLSDSTSPSPLANPSVTTTYSVTITNPTGCTGKDSITITVLPTIGVSNGITPNGDGKNDVWEIDGISAYKNCEVEIYNRWGEKLFSSPGYTEKWDGKYKGKDLPVGTYYYVINLNDEINKEKITGPITIMR